jgi:signal transduction histidine kinase
MLHIAILSVFFASLTLGLLVLLNSPKQALNRYYFAFSVFSSIWLVSNFMTTPGLINLEGQSLLFFGRLITPSSLLALLFYIYFIHTLRKFTYSRWLLVIGLMNIVISSFAFSSGNVYLLGDDLALGWLYPFYGLCVLTDVLAIMYLIFAHIELPDQKTTRTNQQLMYLKLGVSFSFVPIVITGVIIPFFTEIPITNYAPVFAFFFIAFSAIAIIRHKLFDIRRFVAKAVAYVMLLGTVTVSISYGVTQVGASLATTEELPNLPIRLGYTFAAIVLAIAFQPLKRFFDRLTNRLFYQDAYDPQVLLDDLNQVLVGTISLSPLLTNSAEIIRHNLKADHCSFVMNSNSGSESRIIGPKLKISDESLKNVKKHLQPHQKLYAIDSLESDQQELGSLLQGSNISVLGVLSADPKKSQASIGYILVGPKMSGNPYSSKDLKILEIILNELVIAIQNALRFEEIENFNLTLQEKVNEATRKLRQTNDKLKVLDETKDDFISMASHQLRTPLTSVKGYLSMVLEGDAGKLTSMQKKLLGQAFISSQRMVFLIADLLNVSRLKTGKFIIESKPTKLADIVDEEISQLQETADSRGLELIYKRPEHFPVLMLDETKIRQVIMNFIDNAIYYTPTGGKITVGLSETDAAVELKVMDSGIGVPKSEQHHLFSKFYRAGNARKARPDGTGLGLFMAKKVIIAQGGSLIFTSHEGKGSTFGFTFPKSKVRVPEIKQDF